MKLWELWGMRGSEMVNRLSNIQDFTSNLGNGCKNIKFIRYIGKFIIFHFAIILKSCNGNLKRRARGF